MGGDQLVAALAGEEWTRSTATTSATAEKALYLALIEEVEPLEGARELIEDLKDRGHSVVLASSAKQDEVDHYLDLLDARDLADDWTTSADVEATKPEPDLVKAAIEKAGGGDAVMVGDTDLGRGGGEARGLETVTVLTGGFSEAELRDAGAGWAFESIAALREGLAENAARLADVARHVVDAAVVRAGLGAQHLERLLVGDPVALHEDPLRPLDRGAPADRLLELADRVAQLVQLGEPADGDLERALGRSPRPLAARRR